MPNLQDILILLIVGGKMTVTLLWLLVPSIPLIQPDLTMQENTTANPPTQLPLYIVVHRRNSGFHGLPLPIVQPASLDAQLCRAFRLRFLLDRGTVQTRGSPGAEKEKHCFFVAVHNVFFPRT